MVPHLMRPEWLWALAPALLLALLLWRRRGRSGSWQAVIAPELLPFLVGPQTGARAPVLLPFILVGWILAALAASGPSWQKIPQPVHQKQDALVLVLDLSYSMKSGDLAPSRLDRARQKLLDLLEQRREGQTGLIAYAGDAHIVTPLTDDTPTIANLLPALSPDMMPVPGSDPAAAVAQAVALLHSAGIRDGKVLLVTDGVKARDRKDIARVLARSGATFSVLGVGTPTGAPIPLPRGGFLKDRDGTIVMPGLDGKGLQDLASDTGGRYLPMQIDNSDLEILLAEPVVPAREPTLALDRTADTWEDQGYLFILPLLPLVLALFRRGWILCLLPLLFIAQPRPASAGVWDDLWLTPDQQGSRALQQDEAGRAASLFENPAWAATAAYEDGDYEAAAQDFSRGDDADSWYNRGNALARAGQLDEAIAAYRESLARAPGKEDASENLALLERLKEQQQEQQGENQEQHQDQQQQEGENQEQQQDQQQQQGENQEQQQGQQQQEGENQEQQQGQQQQPGENQEEQQDRQQQPGENQEQQQGQQQDRQEESGQEQKRQQPGDQLDPADEAPEQQQESDAQAEPLTGVDPEEQERNQAMEQWLRRVPDDPSGLLREKFRYESYQRQQQGAGKDDETFW